MSAPQVSLIHQFGDFELDIPRRVLMTRAGAPVDITGRVMDALIHLVERPGQLIEKKALIDAVWPNVVVEEGNLSQTIHTLRKALGEKAGEHRYIATVPGRGYQFVAAVTTRAAPIAPPDPATAAPIAQPMPEAPASRRPRWIVAAAVVALALLAVIAVLVSRGHEKPAPIVAVTAQPSIAVLPFVDMSSEQDQAHFAEGLSEEILNILAHADRLRVIARTSSFSFRDDNADIQTIAQRLDVTHVLEGSVRKSGGKLRITAQLIDAKTSTHVWSDTFDRDEHDILGVQREIATAVADALRVKLARVEPRRAETANPEAYAHYLEARMLFNRRSGTDLVQAKAHFEKAVEIDPDYARAWAGLAGVYFVLPSELENVDLPNRMQKWREAAEHAVSLAPDLAEAQVRLAQYEMNSGKAKEAQVHYERAKALDPGDPLVLSIALSDSIYDGHLEQAVEVQRRMVAIDPLSASHRGNLGALLMLLGHLKEAQAELERALELSPASVATTQSIADVLILQGRTDDALAVIARMPEGYLRDERTALVEFARGNTRAGNEILARLETQAMKAGADPGMAVSIAEIHARRGERERAFEWLERARPRSVNPSEAYPNWALRESLQSEPYLDSLRTDPRWNELMRSLDL